MSLPPTTLLEDIASDHDQSAGFTPRLIRARANLLNQLIAPGAVLDLGCADGLLTRALAEHHRRVVAVDASTIRVDRTRAATRGLDVVVEQAYFEEFTPDGGERFDAVILSCILEHLDDPGALLARCASFLAADGVVAVIVPHGRSFHRRAGVHMGLLPDLEALGEADDALDHKRVYTLELLRSEFVGAGLEVVHAGGIMFKPLPNARMADLPGELTDAYEALGGELPDLAAEIYSLGRVPR